MEPLGAPVTPTDTPNDPHQKTDKLANNEVIPAKKEPKTTKYISIEQILENNKLWAERQVEKNPFFFKELCEQQKPQILWIGCSDSRVPSNQILDLEPGQVFTARNIANVVTHTDLNVLSVISYAVEILKVRHIIVCGHYGCGGIIAAETNKQYGLIDNWLRHIKDLYHRNKTALEAIPPGKERSNLLVELNVAQSVDNVCHTTTVQNAWAKGQYLEIHGWVYSLEDGVICPMGLTITGPHQIDAIFRSFEQEVAESIDIRGRRLTFRDLRSSTPNARRQSLNQSSSDISRSSTEIQRTSNEIPRNMTSDN